MAARQRRGVGGVVDEREEWTVGLQCRDLGSEVGGYPPGEVAQFA